MGAAVFKKQTAERAKEAFLGEAGLQRAVLQPCTAILHLEDSPGECQQAAKEDRQARLARRLRF